MINLMYFSDMIVLFPNECKMSIIRRRGPLASGTFFFIHRPLLSRDEVASGRQGTSSKHGGGTAGNSG